MAKSDVLVRMKADTKNYDANIAKARMQLEGFKEANLSASGAIKQLTGSLISAAAKFASVTAVAGTVASAIGEVATESIKLAKESEGIRQAFERLNRADLLDNLREATHNTVTDIELMKQAVKFNDFRLNLDEMGTLLAFAQQKAKDTGQSVDYMVDSIVTGLGRQSLMILDNLGLSASEIKERMAQTGDMTSAVAAIIKDQMANAGDYIETAADRAAQAEVALKNEMESLGRTMIPLEEKGVGMWNNMQLGAIKFLNEGLQPVIPPLLQLSDTIGSIYNKLSDWGVIDGYASALSGLADQAARAAGPLGLVYSIMRAIGGSSDDMGASVGAGIGKAIIPFGTVNSIDEVIVTGSKSKVKKTPRSSTKSVDPSIKIQEQLQSAMLKANVFANGLSPQESGPSELWKMITQGAEESTNQIESLTAAFERLNEVEGVTELDAFKGIKKDADESSKSFQNAASSIAAVGSALQTIEDPSAKIAGIIGQAIANIALGFAQATSKASGGGPFAWIAAIAGGLGTMVSTIAAIHSATGYAQGGVIPGNSYSGDNQWARVNAGETILTRAQAGNLASQLEGVGLGNLQLSATISGEQIRLALNNNGRRTGRGEYVTTTFKQW